jgi:acetylornithine deacetylase/succinyl-diaminopimelate desuccinylase family protein
LENKALARISREELVSLTRELVKIQSVNPPGNEKNVAESIVSWLRNNGIEAYLQEVRQDRPNALGIVDGESGGKILILNGHTDVVPTGRGWGKDPFGAEVLSGRIYGRGANDMKGGLAAMMVAIKTLKESCKDFRGSILFQAVMGEEVDGSGTEFLVRQGLKADFAIIGEPTNLEICLGHKGNFTFRVRTYGKAAHASVPHLGSNAIVDMYNVVDGLEKYSSFLKDKVGHPLLGCPTLNIGTIQGGTKSNIVPDECSIEVDRRVVPPENVADVEKEARKILQQIEYRHPNLRYDYDTVGAAEPSMITGGEDGLKALRSSAEEILGKKPEEKALLGTCDARFFNNTAHIPAVIFGPGTLGQAHVPDEYIDIDQLVSASKIYALTALTLCQQSRK